MRTSPSPTPFAASIRGLEARCGQVALGWQSLYNSTLSKLAAVQCPARAAITLHGPSVLDISLEIKQRGADPVVAGILRKLERATSQTCEVCARPGSVRSLGHSVRVLCGSCAGPRYAAFAVTRLIADLESTAGDAQGNLIWWDDVPCELRVLLPASAWRMVGVPGKTETAHATSHEQLQRHGPWLDAVRRALEEAVEKRELE